MSARANPARDPARPRAAAPPARAGRGERRWVAALLVLHASLALWGAAKNSVTFDENFHVPSGALIAGRAEYRVSAVNPPLVKALCGAAALAAGARLPSQAAMGDGEQGRVGEAFLRANADRYHHVFFAARAVIVALSVLLGWLVWKWARRLSGRRGGLFALTLYALAPEALAHAGVASLDLGTALGFLASLHALWGFARSGRWGWWAALALAVGATFLTRFAAVLLVPALLIPALVATATRRARRPGRLWVGLALLPVTTLLLLDLGYLGRTSWTPLGSWHFASRPFQSLQRVLPALPVPLPDTYVGGFDRQLVESGAGVTRTYLLGRIRDDSPWTYFPIALAVKWPLAFLLALGLRAAAVLRRAPARLGRGDAFLLTPVAVYLAVAMFFSNLCIGIRYVLPILPFLCVWCGGLAARAPRAAPALARAWARIASGLALLLAVETGLAAPWYLAFFNWGAGGPGNGDRIVNDSNVDWGQGLIALHDTMRRLGIGRVYLTALGTTDPAVYGIDSVPYLGGPPGRESDWLAVSSFYLVGLPQRMMTARGRTDFVAVDFRALEGTRPVARPARCLYLFRIR